MNMNDLSARNIGSMDGYQKLYVDGITQFTKSERDLLIKYVSHVDKVTAQRWPSLHDIKWKFCKVSRTIENGWPHTLGDVIILSPKFFDEIPESKRSEILLHEKIHVYQRKYPVQTDGLIRRWGMQAIDVLGKYSLARNNPDINNFVYSIRHEGQTYAFLQLYDQTQPNNLSESSVYIARYPPEDGSKPSKASHKDLKLPEIVSQYEHPYEIMATFIPNILLYNYTDDTAFTKSFHDWLQTA